MPEMELDPRLDPTNQEHVEYVRLMEDFKEHYENARLEIWEKALEWWDMYLARQEDTRDPVDEQWRSNVFVPLPFSTTRTKVAQLVEHLTNADPVWQIEARREDSNFYDQSRPIERLVQYAYEMNAHRKFYSKLLTARSVQGTAFFKVVYTKRSHIMTFYPSQRDYQKFVEAVGNAQMFGAPPAPDYLKQPQEFEDWRKLVNKAQRFGNIPAPPIKGPRASVEYEGPLFQYVPLWNVYVDPLIDEMVDQPVIIHRMVKPLSYIMSRADDLPAGAPGSKPYLRSNVELAMSGWDGDVLHEDARELAEKLRLNPLKEENPYLEGGKGVELLEVWSRDEKFKYAIIMNRKAVINKTPFENPLLTTTPNIFAVRNIMVPGHFDGLSDYQEPESLFQELNKFRRLRQDGATLTTLPVFVKQAGVALGDALRKLRPGMVLSTPGAAASVTTLIKHQLPPEAYREPPELKEEISDATEVPPYLKGAQANVGRVTGTEFQGRAARTDLKYKVDASIVEDELKAKPSVILSFFAQMRGDIRQEIGGDPDALIDISKEELIRGLGMRFRLRGVTRAVDRDLQVQQLIQTFAQFQDVMTPAERRFALTLSMEMMDIRGWSKVVTTEGTQQITGQADAAAGADNAQNQAVAKAGAEEAEAAPGQVDPSEAQAMGGSGGDQQGPQ